jgi:fatty-acyl-CoA synthase
LVNAQKSAQKNSQGQVQRHALTLGDTLAWPARYLPHKEAIVVSDAQGRRAWSYAQLDAEVNRHAHGMQQLGIGKGDVVAAFLYNTPAFVFTLLAAARLGAIFNPINYRLAAQELAFILQDGGAKALVFEDEGAAVVEKARALLPQLPHWIYADPGATPVFATARLDALAAGQPTTSVDVQVGEDDACILMYTSGTTGRPKGVLHTHRSKLAHNAMMHQVMQFRREDVGLSLAPLNHTAELHTSFLPRLQVGATQVLQRRFDAADALRLVEQERVTFFFAAPTMVTMLLNEPTLAQRTLTSLRLVEYGGASMAPHLIREWTRQVGSGLVQVFGTTEMGPCMSVLYPHEQLSHAGSAGLPSLNHDLLVARVREDGAPSDPFDPCVVGEVGEILVRGPCMMAGYLNRPDANAKALAHGWYHTGDLGHIDGDGYLWIRDRIDYMINSGAENVYPREVEDALIEHPEVFEAAVVGEKDARWGQIVAAYVVAKPGAALTAEQLDDFLVHGDRLAGYKRPRVYHFVKELPKTTSGKIQKHLLRQPD